MPPVAVVGMAVLLPGAPDLATYWRNLLDGVDAIGEVPAGRWDPEYYDPQAADGSPDRLYCRRGGFVDGLAQVQPTRFGMMPNSVAATEPDQLIALQVADAAIADAGGPDRLPDRDRVGVVLGRGGYLTPGIARLDQRVRGAHQLTRTLSELLPQLTTDQLDRVRAAFTERLGPDQPEAAIGLVPNLAASRLANRLDLRGPAYTVDAACASSLVAVDQAVGELASGRCDTVLAGGVHHCHDVTLWSVFAQLRALSPSQRIRPFHRGADGILIGEGTGVVVLKRLEDAERDGDRVYAVIRGTGVAGDGRTAALASPDPGGQRRAVEQAWRAAGCDPAAPGALGLLEAHGTATPAGDAAELATLAQVFGQARAGEQRAVLGSVKSMIGHTMPAAGIAGLVKAALAVHHGVLLPTLHCEEPHPALAGTRFRPIAAAEPWEAGSGPRRAGVNAFGFGGINAHVVLEQAPGTTPSPVLPLVGRAARSADPGPATATVQVVEPERVLRLAADSPAQLAALVAGADDPALLRAGRPEDGGPAPRCRLAVVDPTPKRLAVARRAVARGRAWRGRSDVWHAPAPLLGPGGGRLAFLFPGLEGEFAPRVADVADHFGLPRPPVGDGTRVGDVGRHGAGVVAVGRLLDAALRRIGLRPDAVAGHSVGEWTAMIAGGLYSGASVDAFLTAFDPDALRVPGLAFAALGTSADRVLDALATLPGMTEVVLSHDNAPQQAIVCGLEQPVAELVRRFRERGVLGQVLPFRSGFHTPMLGPYLAPIRQAAEQFELHTPAVPVWSGTTAAPFPAAEAEVRALFLRHLLEPVRFRPLVEALYAAGFRAFVQVGTGQLGSLVADTLHDREHLAVAANAPQRDGLAQLRRVAAALWVDGAEPDAAALRPARAGQAAARREHPAVPLDLGSALVSLDRAALGPLIAETAPRSRPEADPLGRLGEHSPLAAELHALLRETERTATELIGAAEQLARRVPAAAPRGDAGRDTARLHISLDTMPYLADHCFFRQRPDWPDPSDRWPVVPATTIVQHLLDSAEAAAPGRIAVGARDLRFGQWVPAAEPLDVEIALRQAGPDLLNARFGQFADGVVELGDRHDDPPAPWPVDPEAEQRPELTAARLYQDRWMFHGPAFQGLTELTAIGATHVRGVITAPAAPGALLDNVGQLLGYWIMATRTERTVVFPVAIRRLRYHGPAPRPGARLHCHLRITALTDNVLEAEGQLRLADGTVWAELHGWQDRRFDSHPETRPVERFVDRHTLGRPQPGGWVLLHERWPDLASRDLIMRNHLGAAERERYAQQPPRTRRAWLLGRIAVKDAVRRWLWEQGEGPVFPAEIEVRNDPDGRPVVTGLHGRVLPPLDVSLAHRAEAAAALVRPAGGGVGIDLEEVVDRPAETLQVALGAAESALLTECRGSDGGSTALWFTRFWAAKEAAAKAAGTGLRGRPRDFAVVAAEGSALVVEAAGPRGPQRHHVHWAVVDSPPGLPLRQYVAAWTTGEGPQEQPHKHQHDIERTTTT
ncbi:type I polyketide synthase [Kitasatospora paracochleata]|uniref:Acyl transferase domain-containing protein/phosphopantetheinyl transferase n=1 Tax=Kitasatospora paracochleata TaxID=58354 RepID=A0ABT1IY18_9ACTN|nr:type I polyketide synthase [Kitasatospora paracochleata]MCP2309416.1 acyl transferase domain-containing protein/phosphopantetheinyl transferase [Kitasatospora paracochleata]